MRHGLTLTALSAVLAAIGGVVAANVDLSTSSVLGDALVSYSSCSIERAVLGNSALTKVRPIAMRSWVDLSNVVN